MRLDFMALLGVVIGFAAILGGNYLEGGSARALLNTPAGIIVLGGTLGAVILQTPVAVLKRSLTLLGWMLMPPLAQPRVVIKRIVGWAKRSRKSGLLGLEAEVDAAPDEFSRKGLMLLIDGSDPSTIRQTLELDSNLQLDQDLAAANVFRAMGGYAPTIGIIGAVLGLIQVMGNLDDPAALGAGIATAFVATIYGVGFANLLLLPIADRLRQLALNLEQHHALLIDGILAVAEGEHPRIVETRLSGYAEVAH